MKFSGALLGLILMAAGFLLGFKFSNRDAGTDNSQNKLEARLKGDSNQSQSEDIDSKPLITADDRLNDNELRVISLFENAAPAVVFITTSTFQQSFWSFDVTEIPKGSGTGFMWDNDGHIVTNYHVIESGQKYSVSLADQTSYEATLVGYEASKDLAVLKIDAPKEKLKYLPKGESENLKVGQSVLAIGNPFGFDQTLTTGIISALGREITARNGRKIYDVIQTDAAINPGNSGGPLLNSSGELIGVNTAIYSPSGAYSGIGFSIPVDVVKAVVPDLIQYGEVKRPLLGVSLVNDRYFRERGAMIHSVTPGSPAERAGLKGIERTRDGRALYGDIIKYIDDQEITNSTHLMEVLERYQPNERVKLQFKREGKLREVELILTSSVND